MVMHIGYEPPAASLPMVKEHRTRDESSTCTKVVLIALSFFFVTTLGLPGLALVGLLYLATWLPHDSYSSASYHYVPVGPSYGWAPAWNRPAHVHHHHHAPAPVHAAGPRTNANNNIIPGNKR